MTLTNKVYDRLKWITQYLLPGLGTLYFALASIWGLPYGEQIVGTLSALTVFLGVILGISTEQYKKSGDDTDGVFLVDTRDPERDIYRIALNDDLAELSGKDRITLVVNPNATLSQE